MRQDEHGFLFKGVGIDSLNGSREGSLIVMRI